MRKFKRSSDLERRRHAEPPKSSMKTEPMDDEPDNEHTWLLTYSDTITLLFCFLLILIGVSRLDQGKLQEVKSGLRESLGVREASESKLMAQNPKVMAQYQERARRIDEVSEKIREELNATNLSDQVEIQTTHTTITITLLSGVLFLSGQSKMTEDAYRLVTSLISKLSPFKSEDGLRMIVEGHTDSQPIGRRLASRTGIEDNWAPSSMRAREVVKLLQDSGFPGSSLELRGMASGYPRAAEFDSTGNYIPEAMAKNRRVVIRLLTDEVNTAEGVKEQIDWRPEGEGEGA